MPNKLVLETSIFELPRVKKYITRLFTNTLGEPPPPPPELNTHVR